MRYATNPNKFKVLRASHVVALHLPLVFDSFDVTQLDTFVMGAPLIPSRDRRVSNLQAEKGINDAVSPCIVWIQP